MIGHAVTFQEYTEHERVKRNIQYTIWSNPKIYVWNLENVARWLRLIISVSFSTRISFLDLEVSPHPPIELFLSDTYYTINDFQEILNRNRHLEWKYSVFGLPSHCCQRPSWYYWTWIDSDIFYAVASSQVTDGTI